MQTENAGSASICGIESVGGGIKRQLPRSNSAGGHAGQAGQDVGVKAADAIQGRHKRIVDFRIHAADSIDGIAIPQMPDRLACEPADGRALQDHARTRQRESGKAELGNVLAASKQRDRSRLRHERLSMRSLRKCGNKDQDRDPQEDQSGGEFNLFQVFTFAEWSGVENAH